jgi:hypothetical protein
MQSIPRLLLPRRYVDALAEVRADDEEYFDFKPESPWRWRLTADAEREAHKFARLCAPSDTPLFPQGEVHTLVIPSPSHEFMIVAHSDSPTLSPGNFLPGAELLEDVWDDDTFMAMYREIRQIAGLSRRARISRRASYG